MNQDVQDQPQASPAEQPKRSRLILLLPLAVFLALAAKAGAFGAMTKGLDSRAKRVRHELDEAKRLREEAAAVLADYKRRRTEAEREAEAIVASAREEAELLKPVVQQQKVPFGVGELRTRCGA